MPKAKTLVPADKYTVSTLLLNQTEVYLCVYIIEKVQKKTAHAKLPGKLRGGTAAATAAAATAARANSNKQMEKSLKVVRLRGVGILEQLVIEEVLLRKSASNYLILNSGISPKDAAIVLGFSGKITELVNVDHLMKNPIHLVRRYTGGGTVVVDQSTLFATFIMNAKDVQNVSPYPREIMTWSERVYKPVFDRLVAQPTGANTFSLRENDYVLGDKKIGGNAQTITKDRWVHHTSFLWNFDPEMMKYLQLPKKMPEYRHRRDHGAFLTTLKQHLSSIDDFETALCSHLASPSFLYKVHIVGHADINREVQDLLNGAAIETVARTKLLDPTLAFETPTLVKLGPSCTNL